MTPDEQNRLKAGTRIITSDGRRGVVIWPPKRIHDGRWRVLCRFDGYEQFHDCDRVRVDVQSFLFDIEG